MKRDPLALEADRFDVAVIGAGIVGAAVAFEATIRGLRVCLIDREDFGGATSANNLRILHGGVRSLSRRAFRQARRARAQLVEWWNLAPHLVSTLPVLVPMTSRWVPRVGAATSNAILSPGAGDHAPHARSVTTEEILGVLPGLDPSLACGGLMFEDGIVYSVERLVLHLVAESSRAGATVANYMEVTGAEVCGGRIEEVHVRDGVTGHEGRIAADLFVNATGPSLADVDARLGAASDHSRSASSYSANLLVAGRGLPCAVGLGTERRMFVVPWRGDTVIGTAHFPVGEHPTDDEITEHLLAEVNAVWPAHRFTPDDVRHLQTGWVLANSKAGEPSRLSERAIIRCGRTAGCRNLVSAAAAKYTAALDVARRALMLGARQSGMTLPPRPSVSVGGGSGSAGVVDRSDLAATFAGMARDVVDHTFRAYGRDAARVLAPVLDDPDAARRVVPGSPVVAAHLTWGVSHEMATSSADLLDRRTELGARGQVTPEAARLAAAALAS